MIPYKSINISELNAFGKGTLSDLLQMKVIEVGEDFLKMSMPVLPSFLQSHGVLHGGAVAALAENAGSLASSLVAGKNKITAGIVLTCNHMKSVRSGEITATAKALHLGRSSHVWEVSIHDEQERLTNVCRITMSILDKK